MRTYIETVKSATTRGSKDTINVNEFSDGTADVWIWRGATNSWDHIGAFPNVQAACTACRNLERT
jgi:hypothetical protein